MKEASLCRDNYDRIAKCSLQAIATENVPLSNPVQYDLGGMYMKAACRKQRESIYEILEAESICAHIPMSLTGEGAEFKGRT